MKASNTQSRQTPSTQKIGLIIFSIVLILASLYLAKYVYPIISTKGTLLKTVSVHFNYSLFGILCFSSISLYVLVHHIYIKENNSDGKVFSRLALGGLVLFSIISFYLGISFPLFTGTKFWVFEQSSSIIDTIKKLLSDGEVFIGSLILIFTIVFPAIKYVIMLFSVIERINYYNILSKISTHLGKWSMLDVFVLAIIIINIKQNDASLSITSKTAVFYLSFAIISSIIASTLIGKINKKAFHNMDTIIIH